MEDRKVVDFMASQEFALRDDAQSGECSAENARLARTILDALAKNSGYEASEVAAMRSQAGNVVLDTQIDLREI